VRKGAKQEINAQLRTLGVRVGCEESAVIDITFLNR